MKKSAIQMPSASWELFWYVAAHVILIWICAVFAQQDKDPNSQYHRFIDEISLSD